MTQDSYTLSDLTLHKLIKPADQPAQIELRPTNCAPSAAAERLVSRVCALYTSRSSKGYSRFGDEPMHASDDMAEDFVLARQLHAYVVDKRLDFHTLTQKMMQALQHCFDADSGEESGYVLIARLQEGNTDTLWIALLGEQEGIAVSGALDILDCAHLDLTQLRAAARIDLSGWQRGDERYLSFLKGRSDIAPWFKRFLGCAEVVVAAKETKKLVRVLHDFAESSGLEANERDALLQRAHAHLDELSEQGAPLALDELIRDVTPYEPERLEAALQSQPMPLNEGFVPDRRAILPLVRFKASAEQWKIEFERSGLLSGAVQYDRASDTLVLSGVPDYLKKMLLQDN